MPRSLLNFSIACVAISWSALANASMVVLDFEVLGHDDATIVHIGPTHSENGFTVSAQTSSLATIGSLLDGNAGTQSSYSGSTALFIASENATQVITNDQNLLFRVISIDLSEADGNQNPIDPGIPGTSITFVGEKPGGTAAVQTFTLDGIIHDANNGNAIVPAETFFFDSTFANLESLSWSQGSGSANNPSCTACLMLHQFDNVVLLPVPEPATGLLVALGLGGMATNRFPRALRCGPVSRGDSCGTREESS